MPDAEGLHRCPVCLKGYKRREHLQRHRSSHTSERPHRCTVCHASFQRTDVLKRHLQTCNGTSAVSSNRRRACDRCVRQKKACNSQQPCQNCDRRGVQCEYVIAAASAPSTSAHPPPWDPPANPAGNGVPPNNGNNILPHIDLQGAGLGDMPSAVSESSDILSLLNSDTVGGGWYNFDYGPEDTFLGAPEDLKNPPAPVPRYRGYSFDFLYDFTSRTGLVSSFECATLERRQQIVAAFDQAYISSLEPFSQPLQFASPVQRSAADRYVSIHHDASTTLGAVPAASWLHNPIIAKLQDIVLLIRRVVTSRPNNSVVSLTWTASLERRCIEFFSPYRFSKFLQLYWSVWHPNVSIIHRPTFDQLSSKSVLLAAMALLGACVSPDSQDNQDARLWLNCVEEMVFTDEDFCADAESPTDVASPATVLSVTPKLQALQAAYIVCLYQNWEGADASKRRIRRHRFSTVVSAVRDIGIETARHPDYTHEYQFNWQEYVVREELIRTFMWIFLLDTAFVIFNNLPHRMVFKEMMMHMASPEPCFQAVSAEECIRQIHVCMPSSSLFCRVTLRDVIEKFCAEALPVETQQMYAQLGALNFFIIVSAFHYMIFQLQNSLAVAGQLVPIRTGLENWIAVWEHYFDAWSSSCPQDSALPLETMWTRMGFIRFAPEWWLLGMLLTDRIAATNVRPSGPRKNTGDNGAVTSSHTAPDGGSAHAQSVEPILGKYDQTSMRQVNDLISDFQKFRIE